MQMLAAGSTRPWWTAVDIIGSKGRCAPSPAFATFTLLPQDERTRVYPREWIFLTLRKERSRSRAMGLNRAIRGS